MKSKHDELDDALMDDAYMLVFMEKAMKTQDAAAVLQVAQTIVRARDSREIALREFVNDPQWT